MPTKHNVLMLGLALALALAFSVPASAQTKVWTNADLGKPLNLDHRPTPSAELTEMTAHQYKYLPPLPDGPTVIILRSSGPTLSPWSFPVSTPTRRLDGTSIDAPPTIYGNPFLWSPYGPSVFPRAPFRVPPHSDSDGRVRGATGLLRVPD